MIVLPVNLRAIFVFGKLKNNLYLRVCACTIYKNYMTIKK
jgi:hypothetical protein